MKLNETYELEISKDELETQFQFVQNLVNTAISVMKYAIDKNHQQAEQQSTERRLDTIEGELVKIAQSLNNKFSE